MYLFWEETFNADEFHNSHQNNKADFSFIIVSMKRGVFPALGAVCFLSLVIFYSAWTTGIGCNAAGLLDHASLMIIFLLMNEILRQVPGGWVRSAGRLALIATLAIFFFLNTLHFRFFHTWGDASAARVPLPLRRPAWRLAKISLRDHATGSGVRRCLLA